MSSSAEILRRRVYKAVNRPLTVCGIERRLFFMSLLVGAATFNLFYSLLAGSLIFVTLYAFAFASTKRDVQMLRILLSSAWCRRRYDPAKHTLADVEIVPC
ncbi:MAG: VirB3 family type IV secretion system protein [Rhodospirillaceae bacterium]